MRLRGSPTRRARQAFDRPVQLGRTRAIAIGTDGSLIDAIIDQAPPTLVPRGANGWFDVGGRRLFLRCTGTGAPTVVFENGLTADWYDLQNRLSHPTRVCSYDLAARRARRVAATRHPGRAPAATG
jgi:hypothetical protein